MPKKTNNRLILALASLLLLVVAASAAVLWFLPPAQPLTPPLPKQETPSSDTAVFDLNLFNRSEYQALNIQLISSGALPVEPPAAIGKANPFL